MTEGFPYRENIRAAWVATDDSAARLADVGMDPIRFWAIIRGTRNPSSLDLALLATAFRTTVDQLTGRTPQHVPVIVYNRNDPEHVSPPAEVCEACTDWETGQLVPASFCEEARQKMEPHP